MSSLEEACQALRKIPGLRVARGEPLAPYTRFGIGGPAGLLAETKDPRAFELAVRAVREAGVAQVVIGGGTNLVVSDAGFPGAVLRFTGDRITRRGERISVESGAALQELVDFANAAGLKGLETLAGIPGQVGAAIYGNAGAYGHSISERVERVRFFDGEGERVLDREGCGFRYRDSVFKRHRHWTIFAAELLLEAAASEELLRISAGILKIRNEKYPPSMKCAGSIFKNLLLAELPPAAAARVPGEVVREGKVPAAWFLEQVGAKGMSRGGIQVADYHANLIYNAGGGTASQLRELIGELKSRVFNEFGVELEEEIQYVGFDGG